jgi:hypothetical protein
MNTRNSSGLYRHRADIGDCNRVYLLLSLVYPSVLGTMIWEFLSRPFDLVIWITSLMVIIHFSLDFLYLKLNLDFYTAEGEFKYDWLLFITDTVIVALIRLAFTTIPEVVRPSDPVFNPSVCFLGIYLLYVLWEFLYLKCNPDEKRSPLSTRKHYILFAIFFFVCTLVHIAYIYFNLPVWVRAVYVIGYLLALGSACAEHYWSVFVHVKETPSGQ